MEQGEYIVSITLFAFDLAVIETQHSKYIGGSNDSFTSQDGVCNWRSLDFPEFLFARDDLNDQFNQLYWEARQMPRKHEGRYKFIAGKLQEVDSEALVEGW